MLGGNRKYFVREPGVSKEFLPSPTKRSGMTSKGCKISTNTVSVLGSLQDNTGAIEDNYSTVSQAKIEDAVKNTKDQNQDITVQVSKMFADFHDAFERDVENGTYDPNDVDPDIDQFRSEMHEEFGHLMRRYN